MHNNINYILKKAQHLSLKGRQYTRTNNGPFQQNISFTRLTQQSPSEERGIDGGKKVKGHKRHIIVDILGNLLQVQVHAANISDTKAACDVFERTSEKHPSIDAYSGDAGYRGTTVTFVK